MEHHLPAICFDFGDTLVDEATEVKDERMVTQSAELIPGVAEMLHAGVSLGCSHIYLPDHTLKRTESSEIQ